MLRLTTDDEMHFIGICLEGFFYGLYSGIFALHLQYSASNKETNKTHNIIFYSIYALYVLSIGVFVSDISASVVIFLGKGGDSILFIDTALFACCDFIAQFILIYRCWIVWGRNIRAVIIPSILAFIFLVTWIAGSYSCYILSRQDSAWPGYILLTSLTLSLTTNALVMGLIVFRIFDVFRVVKATSGDQILATTGGSKLRRILFILIESGMALFSIQLARLVVTILPTDASNRAFQIIIGIHEMLTGITPTIILVRTSMGLSFADEKSMEEFAIESLRIASNHSNSVPETGNGVVDEYNRDDDIGVQRSNDIELVER